MVERILTNTTLSEPTLGLGPSEVMGWGCTGPQRKQLPHSAHAGVLTWSRSNTSDWLVLEAEENRGATAVL